MRKLGMQNLTAIRTPFATAQRGITLTGVIAWGAGLAMAALLTMAVIPEYIQYGTIKRIVASVAQESGSAAVADIRNNFNKRAGIDNVTRITGKDLDIAKSGEKVSISFAYAAQIPLVANISLVIDFEGSASN